MHLVFRFSPESAPQATLKLKVEISTREHDVVLGYRRYPSWWQATGTRHKPNSCPSNPKTSDSEAIARWGIEWASTRATVVEPFQLREQLHAR